MIKDEIKEVNKTCFNCYKYGFISKSGFKAKKEDNLIFISLDDLYK